MYISEYFTKKYKHFLKSSDYFFEILFKISILYHEKSDLSSSVFDRWWVETVELTLAYFVAWRTNFALMLVVSLPTSKTCIVFVCIFATFVALNSLNAANSPNIWTNTSPTMTIRLNATYVIEPSTTLDCIVYIRKCTTLRKKTILANYAANDLGMSITLVLILRKSGFCSNGSFWQF